MICKSYKKNQSATALGFYRDVISITNEFRSSTQYDNFEFVLGRYLLI